MQVRDNDDAFRDALHRLDRGDFSRLEPLFGAAPGSPDAPPRIIEWCEQGRLRDAPTALAEALTCACFLGKELLEAGARLEDVEPPTAYVKGRLKRLLLKRRLAHVDAILRRHRALAV